MTKPASAISEAFRKRLKLTEISRLKMESLFSSGAITEKDINLFYEGLFLRLVTSFEALLEELFLGLIVGKYATKPKSEPKILFKDNKTAIEIMVAGQKKYLDWLPYIHTKNRAEAFFRTEHPFLRLDESEKGNLTAALHIRHAIAHQSKYAKEEFERKVVGSLPLLPKEKTPAGYLRASFRTSPKQTHYENLMITLAGMADKLCK